MRRISIAVLAICVLALAASAQSKASIEREKVEILKIFNEYLIAMQAERTERDKYRERMLTDEYFYMGMDGLPAGKNHVMARQKRNGLRITSLKMSDIVIRLYDKTAVLTMRSTGAGVDMGKPWGGVIGVQIGN